MKLSISFESFKFIVSCARSYVIYYAPRSERAEKLDKIMKIEKEAGNLGKAATVEDATKDIASFTISRSFLGWSLSYIGGQIDTFITDEEAKMLLGLMSDENIKDQAHEVN
jgi:hypothetical protein